MAAATPRAAMALRQAGCEDAARALEAITHGSAIIQHVSAAIVTCVDRVPRLKSLARDWVQGARRMYRGHIVRLQAAIGDYKRALQTAAGASYPVVRLKLLVAVATAHQARGEPISPDLEALFTLGAPGPDG